MHSALQGWTLKKMIQLVRKIFRIGFIGMIAGAVLLSADYSKREAITNLSQWGSSEFAVPTGTAADKLVLSRFPKTRFKYFNIVLDSALAVKAGKADAAPCDEPILRNVAAKNSGLVVLPEIITKDHYGFAVQLNRSDF
jgi:polar amino acid transport system substrate-binding protein